MQNRSDEQRDPEHSGTWYDYGKGYAADPPSRASEAVAWRKQVTINGVKTWEYASRQSYLAAGAEPLYATPPAPQPPVNGDVVAALKEANAFILAPAEDLKEGVLSRIRAALSASPPQGEDAARLDWLEAHPAAEVVRREREWPDNVQWEVCEIHGGRNDREWHVRGVGETVRDALDAAMLAARPAQQGGSDDRA